ncbi:hypothetical protein HPP92_004751 [Vanilla planifolia]|uniref:Protein EARLY HEADING DATE 2 n=1 Tax=Vanilla planifolia TaxID=51239 RepID=A0A835RY37_VANPL|nr:hypothetical protein HPP92_004751 [Vanilla planifolia]
MSVASSSTSFFDIRDEDHMNQLRLQQAAPPLPSMPPSSTTNSQPSAPAKKKRNLPGNPNPDAEVIALSPKTLMATNRFVCEVCKKGFQREQNLQLHRRGHNLPWKLKQKSSKEVRRRVYLCPEPTCVHHDPSRALGDLTGIKKHFSRKHGEKKWKCDKCSKRYAVQSDWKAHSKTCGTREYRCDCGTLFSRRDSFITHRAFCDALAQESSRIPVGINRIGGQLYGGSHMGLDLTQVNSHITSLQNPTDLLRLGAAGPAPAGAQLDQLISSSNPNSYRQSHIPSPNPFFLGGPDDNHAHQTFLQSKPFHGLIQLPELQHNSTPSSAAEAGLLNLGFFSNGSGASSNVGHHNSHFSTHEQFIGAGDGDGGGGEMVHLFSGGNPMSDHMVMHSNPPVSLFNPSLQGDGVLPQMSATALLQKAAQMGATSSGSGGGGGGGGGSCSSFLRGFGSSSSTSTKPGVRNESNLRDIMNSFAHGNPDMFSGGQEEDAKFGDYRACLDMEQTGYNHNGLTRDFLGVGNMLRTVGGGVSAQREQHKGLDVGSVDPEMRPPSSARSFASGGSTLR